MIINYRKTKGRRKGQVRFWIENRSNNSV